MQTPQNPLPKSTISADVTDRQFFGLPSERQIAYLQPYCEKNQIPMGEPLPSRDISVVIQGPIFTQTHEWAPKGITYQVVQNIRKFLPEATIIVATWEGQPLDVLAGLDIDKILTLPDPGTVSFYTKGYQTDNLNNNCNRLIYSTQQGLAVVQTPYVLKIRSDLLMFHPMLSCFFGQFDSPDKLDTKWQVLSQRILSFPMFSIKYEQGTNRHGKKVNQPRPFHVSDWAYFGNTGDVRRLFDCPLVPEPQTSRWFETRPKPENDIWAQRLWRYPPEQYITSNLAERRLGIHLEHASQDTPEIIDASERFIANNFVILDQKLWGLWSLKLQHYQDELKKFIPAGLYHFDNWHKDYEKYCELPLD